MAKGSFPRGFSMSITTVKNQATRVIIWQRKGNAGQQRVKLLDHTLEPGHVFTFSPPAIGGKGNRRKVEVTIDPRMWPDE